MDFERLVAAIMSRRDFGQKLDEVHDAFVPRLCSEEMFFFAWSAADLMGEYSAPVPRRAEA